ncbi:MAG: shikimate kinase [Candidatus Thermoplasmatota archaeon]
MARPGRGEAFGAVTIVNATATGVGCSLAVNLRTTAVWSPGGDGLRVTGAHDLKLVEAVAAELGADLGAAVAIDCPFPPSRGLKTSSSVAAALVRAVLGADGTPADDATVESLAVASCRRAKVTLTGALDDQMAVVRGGCHIVDTSKGVRLASVAAPPWQVALWVPNAAIAKTDAGRVDVTDLRRPVESAVSLAGAGRVAEAMTANGNAFHACYAAAGLPVDDRPVHAALKLGALGAGLSGTGPAVAALFDRRVNLPPVAGGVWRWTRTVPGR